MSFDINDHLLTFAGLDYDGPITESRRGVCACSNPDGNGEGAVEFKGRAWDDVKLAWGEHLISTFSRSIFDSDTSTEALDAWQQYLDIPENSVGATLSALSREQDAFTAGFDAGRATR